MEDMVKKKYELLKGHLNEKQIRLMLGAEALLLGRGGQSIVSNATGVARRSIARGMEELQGMEMAGADRVRKPGGGRKKDVEKDQSLVSDLDLIIEPTTRGDPESPLRWTSKSLRKLAAALKEKGHNVSHQLIMRTLSDMGYSLQATRKTIEGSKDHPDRDAQFNFINELVKSFQLADQPTISVDSKKKENVGQFKNNGAEYQPKGRPVEVNVYDFIDKDLGKVNPYGVYDMAKNEGWVNVGVDADTGAFAVESIRRWWHSMGKESYPKAKCLLITADGGGSNGSRLRLWKLELEKFAQETGLAISVCHFPPGTSKWNKIEHRLFSFITQNWRGRPLVSHEVVVNLIASTTTKMGLKVRSALDEGIYPKGIKVTNKELKNINMAKADFHGEWNYTIAPS
jgi:Rhodopirellula transposase DDE domain